MSAVSKLKHVSLVPLRVPAEVATFDVTVSESQNISVSKPGANAFFSDSASRPDFFVYNSKASQSSQTSTSRYGSRNETVLFWEGTNKIMQGQTLKQQLASVSTDYVLSRFSDEQYAQFFMRFYNTLQNLLRQVTLEYGLDSHTDLCLFYKGGNLFRILLTDFANYLNDEDFVKMLKKRSDADFQIYINPHLRNYNAVYDKVVRCVLLALYEFKKWLAKPAQRHYFDIDYTEIIRLYKDQLEANKPPGFTLQSIGLPTLKDSIVPNTKPFRSDFVMDAVNNKYVAFKEEFCLLRGYTKDKNDYSLYLSRNIASQFETFSGKKYVFELDRLKRNIKLEIKFTHDDKQLTSYLQVPSEVIDVSIPRPGDSSLEEMSKLGGNVTPYIQEYIYTYRRNGKTHQFPFFGVSIQYLIYDLTDILFMKFKYPWLDAKYKKRIDRYFLCIFLDCIKNIGDASYSKPNRMDALQSALDDLHGHLATLHKRILSRAKPRSSSSASSASSPKSRSASQFGPYTGLTQFYGYHMSLKGRLELDKDQSDSYGIYVGHVSAIITSLQKMLLTLKSKAATGDDTIYEAIYFNLFRARLTRMVGGRRP